MGAHRKKKVRVRGDKIKKGTKGVNFLLKIYYMFKKNIVDAPATKNDPPPHHYYFEYI